MIKSSVHSVVHGAILNLNMRARARARARAHTHTHTHTHTHQISNQIVSVLYNGDFKNMISRKKRLKFYNISVKNFLRKNIYIYIWDILRQVAPPSVQKLKRL